MPVERWVTPKEFNKYREIGLKKGFLEVVSGPMVRSSYRAEKALEKNNAGRLFEYTNKMAGELASKARENSKKNILIAGSLPAQNDTYCEDNRD